MLSPFQIDKAIQATAAVLRTSVGHRMSRLRVLKLLYIAEREILKQSGRTITDDRAVAMDHGPVLTSIYSLIKGEHADARQWDQFFEREGPNEIRLIADPGNGKLSRYELEKLSEVSKRFECTDEWALSERTHKFKEWKKNKPPAGSRIPIPLDDVLEALDLLEYKSELLKNARQSASVHNLLSPKS
jgi:uncharacterized phage-associated protein